MEDLKNDDIVERIKRELGQQLSFKFDSSTSKLTSSNELTKKSSECLRNRVYTQNSDSDTVITTEHSKTLINQKKRSSDLTQNLGDHTKTSESMQCSNEANRDISENGKRIKVDPDLKESMKPPDKQSSYVVLNRKLHLERMKRFITMTKRDIPPKTERKFKCEAPLSELKIPVDTIRCSKCGVLYESGILVAHLKTCQGDRRKTKYGCRLCSFTDCDYRQLEGHIKSVHPTRTKK